MNSRSLRLLCGIFILVAALMFVTRDSWVISVREWLASSQHISEFSPLPKVPSSDGGKVFSVKRVQVLKGHQFDLILDDENRILAHLSVRTSDKAKARIIDLLNHCENPKVRLIRKMPDGEWLIDFLVTYNGKEVSLADWLSDNNLVYK